VTTRENLENERAQFTQSHTASTSEVEALKIRLTDFEKEKRDLVGVIARLRTEDEERESKAVSFMPIESQLTLDCRGK
jgi:nitrogen fixation protein FixH